jgi:hypothetical protein
MPFNDVAICMAGLDLEWDTVLIAYGSPILGIFNLDAEAIIANGFAPAATAASGGRLVDSHQGFLWAVVCWLVRRGRAACTQHYGCQQ